MRKWFNGLKVSQKLMLISIFFMMPDSFMLYMFVTGVNADIRFARLEQEGNQYQRPLEQLLKTIPEHRILAGHAIGGDAQARAQLSQKQAEIDAAFDALATADAEVGADLKFTPEGLAARGRAHCNVQEVRQEWENIKNQLARLDLQSCDDQHLHLVADIRTMITHAGDMSNLILDPQMDSYYLMDTTLAQLPQAQDRLTQVMLDGESLIRRNASEDEVKGRIKSRINATMMKEVDLGQISGDIQTALNENKGDKNPYGASESLQARVPPAFKEYTDATQAFIDLTTALSNGQAKNLSAADYLAAGEKSRLASFQLWNISEDELDQLLQKRVDGYTYRRNKGLTIGGCALMAALLLVTFITRSISGPLKQQAAALKAANGALQQSRETLEERVAERTKALQQEMQERQEAQTNLETAHKQLLATSQQAGKAEVAAGVLHNVGNVLNSVNVSANVIANSLRQSEASSLGQLSELIASHKEDLGTFISSDERGKLIPGFIDQLAGSLKQEQDTMLEELRSLSKGVEHIKEIISAQQSLARNRATLTPTELGKMMETALAIKSDSLERHRVEIVRKYGELPPVYLEEHKVLLILINLLANAAQAVLASDTRAKRITFAVNVRENEAGSRLRFEVADNGVGISAENMTRIFSHGFTTKKDGHGFGLHSAANAAKEMGGSLTVTSDGPGLGATFYLEIPYKPVTESQHASNRN